MRIGTIVSLAASAALGLGALLVAKVWLPAQTAATNQTVQAQADAATTPMVVASQAIPYGAKLEAKYLTVVRVPAAALPAGAFSTVNQILNQPSGAPIALVPMSPKEPVLPTKLSGGGARPILAARISEGFRGYTIGITDVLGGGGYIMPGDRVDVILTRDLSNEGEGGGGAGKVLVTDLVVQDVRVLGMDLNADPTSTTAAVAHTATLELTPADTAKIALASQAGTLSLALRRTGETDQVQTRATRINDVASAGGFRPATPTDSRLLGGAPTATTGAPRPPRRPTRPVSTPMAEPPRSRGIVVTHGDNRTTVEVPADRAGA